MTMARRRHIQYPGARYHVMNRGDQPEAIFRDDEDRQRFLSTPGEACPKTRWQVHADCPMNEKRLPLTIRACCALVNSEMITCTESALTLPGFAINSSCRRY